MVLICILLRINKLNMFSCTYWPLIYLNHEEIQNVNRPITRKETETVIERLPAKKTSGSDGFIGEFYHLNKN